MYWFDHSDQHIHSERMDRLVTFLKFKVVLTHTEKRTVSMDWCRSYQFEFSNIHPFVCIGMPLFCHMQIRSTGADRLSFSLKNAQIQSNEDICTNNKTFESENSLIDATTYFSKRKKPKRILTSCTIYIEHMPDVGTDVIPKRIHLYFLTSCTFHTKQRNYHILPNYLI